MSGTADATHRIASVSATLCSATPGVTVAQGVSAYPNIPGGATATNTTSFTLSTSPAFTCGTIVNLTLVLNYAGGAKTNTFIVPSSSASYVLSQSSGASIVAGTTDVGNHGDDVITSISLPFTYSFYGQAYSSATVSAFTSASQGEAEAGN